jgi:hypothetical protein
MPVAWQPAPVELQQTECGALVHLPAVALAVVVTLMLCCSSHIAAVA